MKSIKNRGRRAAAIGMTCLAIAGVGVFAAPTANAQTNRRICLYSYAQKWYDPHGKVTSHSIWAMNYKKDGGCPTNTNRDSFKDGSRASSLGKITCEDFGRRVGANYDPCPKMTKDSLYYVEWANNGPLMTNHGHY